MDSHGRLPLRCSCVLIHPTLPHHRRSLRNPAPSTFAGEAPPHSRQLPPAYYSRRFFSFVLLRHKSVQPFAPLPGASVGGYRTPLRDPTHTS